MSDDFALMQRAKAIAEAALPCPRCGAMPDIDMGLMDAPFPPGEEGLSCPTVLSGLPGIPEQHCGVYSVGLFAWNLRPRFFTEPGAVVRSRVTIGFITSSSLGAGGDDV